MVHLWNESGEHIPGLDSLCVALSANFVIRRNRSIACSTHSSHDPLEVKLKDDSGQAKPVPDVWLSLLNHNDAK